ncbi:hypothetical protein BB559_002650 [Furculomyces boomerangus]|uniref:Cytochrome P450 n=1 Tax=Furculomyces boomerangus TaxID=61424 RepID=A0A2T9YTT2_9FUNG|nr:hypothetical protein BB559_002650 [Furculomyces boomerangus]
MDTTILSLTKVYHYLIKNYCNSKNFYRFLVAYGVYKTVYYAFFDPLKKVPGPWWSRFTGIPYALTRINGEISRYSVKLHDQYGPIVRVAPNQISVSKSKDIKFVLASYRYPKSKEYMAPILKEPNLLSTIDEARNRLRRRQVGPAFTYTSLDTVEDLVLDIGTHSLKAKLFDIIENGDGIGEFSYFNFFQCIAADVIGELTFGKSFDAVKNEGHEVTKQVNFTIQFSTIMQAYPPLIYFRVLFFRLRKYAIGLGELFRAAIKRRKEEIANNTYESSRVDILQMLITSINEKTKKPLTDEELGAEMAIMLIAGIDTTSVTMTCGVLFRENGTDDVELSGYHIPRGVDMAMFTEGAHYDTSIWESPDSYMPERFLGPDGDRLKKEVIAFSYGVRICLGRNLAWMEMLTVIPNLMRDFDVRLPDDSKYGPNVLDPERNNEPLLLKDKVFATRTPISIEGDCRAVVTLRTD